MEEFEAHHAQTSPEADSGTGPDGPDTESIPIEAEVVSVEPAPEEDDWAADWAEDFAAEQQGEGDSPADSVGSRREIIHMDDPAEVLPALARVAAELWVRAAIWGVTTSLETTARLARAAVDPQAANELYQDLTGGMRAYAREFLGISDLEEQLRELSPLAGAGQSQNGRQPEATLRDRGAQLLRQAADVSYEAGVHPAFARILTELAPDEARVLRTLATEGPQPMVDVRETNLIGIGSQLIVANLNMIGAQAGLRYRDRVEAYLGNLLRLGLIELSDDDVDDAIAYQVLEAQPEVLGTIKETPRAKTVHRSLRLTPFGDAFCRVCLPLEPPAGLPSGDDAEHPAGEDDSTSGGPSLKKAGGQG